MLMRIRFLPFLLVLAACDGGGGPSSGDDPGGPFVMSKPSGSGDGQFGTVATALPEPVRVLVTQAGVPAEGRVVIFAPASDAGTVSPLVDTTGADGIASTTWTLGVVAGSGTLTATSAATGGSPVHFSAVVGPGLPSALVAVTGGGQGQEAGLSFGTSLVVELRDPFGNPIAGVTVAWEVAEGDAEVTAATTQTQANGRASVGLVAGDSLGPITVTATAAPLPGVPVQFSLAVVPPPTEVMIANNFFTPANITIASGTAVRWVWSSGEHNVAPFDGPVSFPPSGVRVAPSAFGPILFTTNGIYTYECSLHAGMTGTITVQ